MNIIEEVKKSWGWTGINPIEIVTENEFGNLIIKDDENKFWRLCPEEIYCEVIAESIAAYNLLITDAKFVDDWNMSGMVDAAIKSLGSLKEGYKFYLAIPGILNGEYKVSNIKAAPFVKIIKWSGELGYQVKDLQDGSEVELKDID